MTILNFADTDLIINGTKVGPEEEITVAEMAFNSQAIYSDFGSVEIVTEYSRRTFRNYGQLKAFEDKKFKDVHGLPRIIVVNTIPQRIYKESL